MEYKLKDFLDGATVIPFSDDILSELENICQSYMEAADSLAIIDEVSSYLYAEIFPTELTAFLQNSILDLPISGIKQIPESLKIRLAQYILYLTITKEEDQSERTFLCTNWMNYTVLKHNVLPHLPNSFILSNLYKFHVSSYILNLYNRSNEDIETTVRKLLSLIPANNYEDESIDFEDSSVWDALRHICDEATQLRINTHISKIPLLSPNVTTIYYALKDVVDLLEYPYYNVDIVNLMDKVLNGKRNTQAELWRYIEQLQDSEIMPICNLESSIILRAIRHKNDPFSIKKKTLKMGIKEFAVYLFYELLLEKIELTKNQKHE